jgi:hypothetical protein
MAPAFPTVTAPPVPPLPPAPPRLKATEDVFAFSDTPLERLLVIVVLPVPPPPPTLIARIPGA